LNTLLEIRRSCAPICLALLLGGCASAPPPEPAGPPPVGNVSLLIANEEPAEARALDIGVQVFTSQAGDDAVARTGAEIFSQIRKTETQYLPVALRSTLVESKQWGIVRVLPEADPSMDLYLEGRILASDGVNLTLHIRATDSTGRLWLDKVYTDVARVADYPDAAPALLDRGLTFGEDPFQDIYSAISNDLLAFQQSLTQEGLERIQNVSQLRYASDLSPEAFSRYLQEDEQGLLMVNRLPARNDPLLGNVADIQARNDVFIDTIDEYYEALYQDVKPIYDIWRQYSFEQVNAERDSIERARSGNANTGSFEAISQNYNRYKWSKIFEQEFVALASGFVSETAPAVLELSRNVNGLTGPVEEQYAQWRVLLRGLFEIETEGLNPTSSADTP
jgi:hypothetical protein